MIKTFKDIKDLYKKEKTEEVAKASLKLYSTLQDEINKRVKWIETRENQLVEIKDFLEDFKEYFDSSGDLTKEDLAHFIKNHESKLVFSLMTTGTDNSFNTR